MQNMRAFVKTSLAKSLELLRQAESGYQNSAVQNPTIGHILPRNLMNLGLGAFFLGIGYCLPVEVSLLLCFSYTVSSLSKFTNYKIPTLFEFAENRYLRAISSPTSELAVREAEETNPVVVRNNSHAEYAGTVFLLLSMISPPEYYPLVRMLYSFYDFYEHRHHFTRFFRRGFTSLFLDSSANSQPIDFEIINLGNHRPSPNSSEQELFRVSTYNLVRTLIPSLMEQKQKDNEEGRAAQALMDQCFGMVPYHK